MQCNNQRCGVLLDGVDFLVTSCGHAFCIDCEQGVLSSARCSVCEAQLTDDDIERCNGDGLPAKRHLVLCGYEPNKILALAGRALHFWENQSNLRFQMEQHKRAEVEKTNLKLKATMTEMHAKHVAGMNILQAKILALEKERDAEKEVAVTLQSRLQNESRQKRRLEDECALLENRRVLRQNFVAQTLKPRNTKMIEAPSYGGASVAGHALGGAGSSGYASKAGLQQGQALARMMPGAENRSSRASGRGARGGEGDCGGTAEFLELSSKSSENDSGSSPPQSTLLSVSGVRGGGGGGGGGGGCGRRDSTGGAARKDSGGGYLLGGGSLPVGRGAADAAADGAKRMLFHLSNSELRQK